MTPPDSVGGDAEFAARLCELDDAIARGATLRSISGEDTLDTALKLRLDRAQRCLILLESLRRVRDAGGELGALDQSTFDPGGDGALQAQPTVDRFAIVRELGRGGYGVVFLAVDPTLNRLVALKLPHPETLLSADLKQRFLREARAAAGLNHPNIVAIHDLGAAGPICWIAAEYCPGVSLADWLNEHEGDVDPKAAAELAALLADAVQHAHERGVLHRDLKPSNVLLVNGERDGSGCVTTESDLRRLAPKLTDFGLAKVVGADSGQTKSGAALGTPSYMPPEQVEHRADAVGPASDVYGLGAILYALLARQPPFQGATSADTLRQVLLDEPVPPRRMRQRLPVDLEAICLKCLDKRPQRRYGSASRLAADLRRFLAGEATEARPPGRLAQAAKWSRRHPVTLTVLLMSAAGVTLIAGGVAIHVDRLSTDLAAIRKLNQEAEAREVRLRHSQYVSDMQLAFRASADNNLEQTLDLLQRQFPLPGQRDERDFAWQYLWNQAHQQRATFAGHTSTVAAVALSPDGRLGVSAGHDSLVRVFATVTGKPIAALGGHRGNVNGLAMSPDGRWFVSGADDGKLIFWSTEPCGKIAEVSAHEGDVLCVAVSHDGRLVASGGVDRTVRLWNAADRSAVGELAGHADWVRGLAFSRAGDFLASASDDHTVRIWNPNDKKLIRALDPSDEWCLAVDFSPDGNLLAMGGKDETVLLVPTATWAGGMRIRPENGWIRSVRFAPDSKRLLVVGTQGRVELWNIESQPKPKLAVRTSGHAGPVWGAAYANDGRHFATAGADGAVKLWEAREDVKWRVLASFPDRPRCFAPSSDGKMAAVAVGQGITLCELPSGRILESFAGAGLMRAAAVTRQGEVVGGGNDAFLAVWRRGAAQPARIAKGQTGIVTGIALHPTKPCFASGTSDGTLRIWTLPECRIQATVTRPGHDLGTLAFSPDGKWLAVEDISQKSVFLCDAQTWQIGRELADTRDPIVFTADGRHLWTGLQSGGVRRWDAATGVGGMRLLGAPEPLNSAALSPDGLILAGTVISTREVVLWDLPSGQVIARLPGHYRLSHSRLLFSPDGQRLYLIGQRYSGLGELVEFSATRR